MSHKKGPKHRAEQAINQNAGRTYKVNRGPLNQKIPLNEEFASELFTGEDYDQSASNANERNNGPVSERSAWN